MSGINAARQQVVRRRGAAAGGAVSGSTPGLDETEMAALENRYGIRFGDDQRALLSLAVPSTVPRNTSSATSGLTGATTRPRSGGASMPPTPAWSSPCPTTTSGPAAEDGETTVVPWACARTDPDQTLVVVCDDTGASERAPPPVIGIAFRSPRSVLVEIANMPVRGNLAVAVCYLPRPWFRVCVGAGIGRLARLALCRGTVVVVHAAVRVVVNCVVTLSSRARSASLPASAARPRCSAASPSAAMAASSRSSSSSPPCPLSSSSPRRV